ncbi:MAG: hypothetical protein JG779_1089 [Thermotoga sp.]|nr:hypothetical protein [Thermotoga sp.]
MKTVRQERLKSIVRILERSKEPISGAQLAEELSVSRQVIVQDIAYLRSLGYNIVATPRGYVLAGGKSGVSRLVAVKHAPEEIKEELLCVVMAKTEPLLTLSGGVHLHTIEAPDEETMERIMRELKKKGFLIEEG